MIDFNTGFIAGFLFGTFFTFFLTWFTGQILYKNNEEVEKILSALEKQEEYLKQSFRYFKKSPSQIEKKE